MLKGALVLFLAAATLLASTSAHTEGAGNGVKEDKHLLLLKHLFIHGFLKKGPFHPFSNDGKYASSHAEDVGNVVKDNKHLLFLKHLFIHGFLKKGPFHPFSNDGKYASSHAKDVGNGVKDDKHLLFHKHHFLHGFMKKGSFHPFSNDGTGDRVAKGGSVGVGFGRKFGKEGKNGGH